MECYDCALDGRRSDAVAVCVDCGATFCLDHGHPQARWLTRTAVINRIQTVHPPGRAIRCGTCATAHHAAAGSTPARRPDLTGAYR